MLKASFLFTLAMVLQKEAISQDTPGALINNMLTAVGHIQTFQFKLKDYERIKGELKEGEEDVKMTNKPLQLYFYINKPDKGAEVLWIEGQNHGNAWVHPNGFPYITLSLNPYGSLMKGGHHAMFDLNFKYLADIIEATKTKLGDKFNACISDGGNVTFDDRPCHKVSIVFPAFRMVDYIAGDAESFETIAKAHHLSEYMIQERNPGIPHTSDLKKGQHIVIPNHYFSTLVLYIENETKLPLLEMFYDNKGLFEKYEFYNLKVNVAFNKFDFSKANPAYRF